MLELTGIPDADERRANLILLPNIITLSVKQTYEVFNSHTVSFLVRLMYGPAAAITTLLYNEEFISAGF